MFCWLFISKRSSDAASKLQTPPTHKKQEESLVLGFKKTKNILAAICTYSKAMRHFTKTTISEFKTAIY